MPTSRERADISQQRVSQGLIGKMVSPLNLSHEGEGPVKLRSSHSSS